MSGARYQDGFGGPPEKCLICLFFINFVAESCLKSLDKVKYDSFYSYCFIYHSLLCFFTSFYFCVFLLPLSFKNRQLNGVRMSTTCNKKRRTGVRVEDDEEEVEDSEDEVQVHDRKRNLP